MPEEKIKIFIVDTSEVWRKILANYISSAGDMEVAGEINSGQGAILMLEETDPDIVMLEVNAKDRLHVTEVISNLHEIKPGIRVILCVDVTRKNEILSAMDLGVYDFITRPYNNQNVIRVIRECMTHPAV